MAEEKIKKAAKKVSKAVQETHAEHKDEIKKEGNEAGQAGKNFLKEVWDWLKAVGRAIKTFFKKLFKKEKK